MHIRIKLITICLSYSAFEAVLILLKKIDPNIIYYTLYCHPNNYHIALEIQNALLKDIDGKLLKLDVAVNEDCVENSEDWFLTDGNNIIYSSVE